MVIHLPDELGPVNTSSPSFAITESGVMWTVPSLRAQRDMQMRHFTGAASQAHSVNPSLPRAVWKTGAEVMVLHRWGGRRQVCLLHTC